MSHADATKHPPVPPPGPAAGDASAGAALINLAPAAPTTQARPALTLFLAAPRGFCAGVDRAIKIVDLALAKFGAPVFLLHEIVHNRVVVDGLRAKGAIFVEELDDIPDADRTTRPVIFSAHGVPKSVPASAKARNMIYLL
ncbi:MAG: hypothetical protein N2439_07220, partial [Anaerolineae bacterium]|nr:hypothetical protein [Anaerolineae bacterium]